MPASRPCWPRLSRAKPKIADYPFTTLRPQLGVVSAHGEEFVLADLPGLIEGASEGAGLGHRFLGHVERCAVILHLIDATEDDVVGNWRTIRGELEAYGHELTEKPEIIALNKADALTEEELDEEARQAEARVEAPGLRNVGREWPRPRRGTERAAARHQGRARSGRRTGKSNSGRAGCGRCQLASMSESLATAKRLIVKIGSALLVDDASGDIRRAWLDALVEDIMRCRSRGQEVLLVSSGAIAVGRRYLGLTGKNLRLEEKQAAAASGQIRLAHAYQEALGKHGIAVAQILLTPEDTEERRRHLNARATIEQLLALGAVPIINENDTVATQEIRFGDNDRLGARVAQMISADTLVLLSDIDGLYTGDPRRDPVGALHPGIARDHAGDRGDGGRSAAPATARAAW